MQPLLGTFVEIGTVGCQLLSHQAIDLAFAEIENIHHKLSFQNPNSELSLLNQSLKKWITLSPPSIRVLKLACAIQVASGGRFDCTVGGKLIKHNVLPNHGDSCLQVGAVKDIEIIGDKVRLLRPIRITLDGIAKGFAVDCAIKKLKTVKLQGGWVNAGGDLRVFGDYDLPLVQRRASGELKTMGTLRQAAMATSYTLNQHDKDRPGLIVDSSVSPAESQSHSKSKPLSQSKPTTISVIARYAWRADALTKVAANTVQHRRAQTVTSLGGVLVEEPALCAV